MYPLSASSILILLDTNILMEIAKTHITIQDEINRLLDMKYEIRITPQVIAELETLIQHSSVQKRIIFNLALAIGKTFPVLPVPDAINEIRDTDKSLIETAIWLTKTMKIRTVVVTNDGPLRRALSHQYLPVFFLRQRSHLELDGFIPESYD